MTLWSGKDLVNNQKDTDRDAEPLQALKNWQYVYQLLEDNIVNSSTVFKIYLALRNAFEPLPHKDFSDYTWSMYSVKLFKSKNRDNIARMLQIQFWKMIVIQILAR